MNFLTSSQVAEKLRQLNPHRPYWVMYSSVWGGLVRDPECMMIPVDDHLVHRGDGIFEACRFHRGRIIELDAHIERLFRSAQMIGLSMPLTAQEIEAALMSVVKASPEDSGMLRLFVSRGFGDFSVNPYSTRGAHVHIVSMPYQPVPEEKYQNGVSVIFSSVPLKPGIFAQVKSCNYLPNVLMKKEAIDRGADFAIGQTGSGEIAEGPTENILVLTPDRELIAPSFDYTLRGTTLLKVLDLARAHSARWALKGVRNGPVSKDNLYGALEAMMVGTTLGVLPVTVVDGRPVHNGKVGEVARGLRELLEQEIAD